MSRPWSSAGVLVSVFAFIFSANNLRVDSPSLRIPLPFEHARGKKCCRRHLQSPCLSTVSDLTGHRSTLSFDLVVRLHLSPMPSDVPISPFDFSTLPVDPVVRLYHSTLTFDIGVRLSVLFDFAIRRSDFPTLPFDLAVRPLDFAGRLSRSTLLFDIPARPTLPLGFPFDVTARLFDFAIRLFMDSFARESMAVFDLTRVFGESSWRETAGEPNFGNVVAFVVTCLAQVMASRKKMYAQDFGRERE